MTSIRPLRLGILGTALALIACAVWFVDTDQPSKVRQRAYDAQYESLAAARAVENGVSVEEMKRRAYAGCNFKVDRSARKFEPPQGAPDLFRDEEQASIADASRRGCIGSYIYGEGGMYEPTLNLFWEWLLAVLKIAFISVGAGAAIVAIFNGSLWGLKSWWNWLRVD